LVPATDGVADAIRGMDVPFLLRVGGQMSTTKEEYGYVLGNNAYATAQEAAEAAARHYKVLGDMTGQRVLVFKVIGEVKITMSAEILLR
jgi:hypothetical protein